MLRITHTTNAIGQILLFVTNAAKIKPIQNPNIVKAFVIPPLVTGVKSRS